MMNKQEQLWSGSFGDEYHERNVELAPRYDIWERILDDPSDFGSVHGAVVRWKLVRKVLEFGCGNGENLTAIKELLPSVETIGVDVNGNCLGPNVGDLRYEGSILSAVMAPADLVITCGLLIHIAPPDLPKAYQTLYDTSRRYICVMEYYNPTPVEVEYRSMDSMLWKRDFAGEMMDKYPLKLIDYGFEYHRDGVLDDITWFLMEKTE
jgi:pseudaminic acid biosynthesis-associated methylase